MVQQKTIKAIQFSIIKIRIFTNFMNLRSKLTSEMCQKTGSLDVKAKQKPSEGTHFWHILLKKPLCLMKNDKHLLTFHRKSKCTYKFYVFTIETAFGNVSETSEFYF